MLSRIGRMKMTTNSRMVYVDCDYRRVPRLRPMWAVCRIVNLRPRAIRTDRTRRGWHVIIEFSRAFTREQLLALQCVFCGFLKGDFNREALNCMRVFAIADDPTIANYWKRRWNILFDGKL